MDTFILCAWGLYGVAVLMSSKISKFDYFIVWGTLMGKLLACAIGWE